MKRLSATSTDSLDLLLGPMCNTFGVLILVACITALFIPQSADENPGREISPTEVLLQRRINVAQEESGKLKELMGDGATVLTAEQAKKLKEIARLRKVLAALQQKTADPDKGIQRTIANETGDPYYRPGQLNEQLLTNERELAHQQQTAKMRFPRERSTHLAALYLIVRYGRVFPVRLADSTLNPDVARVSFGADRFEIQPNPSAGWSVTADKSRIEKFLSDIDKDKYYFAVSIYPDSFETWQVLEQMILEASHQFGLEIQPEDHRLIFLTGKKGAPPPKPL